MTPAVSGLSDVYVSVQNKVRHNARAVIAAFENPSATTMPTEVRQRTELGSSARDAVTTWFSHSLTLTDAENVYYANHDIAGHLQACLGEGRQAVIDALNLTPFLQPGAKTNPEALAPNAQLRLELGVGLLSELARSCHELYVQSVNYARSINDNHAVIQVFDSEAVRDQFSQLLDITHTLESAMGKGCGVSTAHC